MRHLPTLPYKGLTIVLSNASRYDNDRNKLLSAHAGTYFFEECLQPWANRFQCDIRTSDTIEHGLLPNTRGILALGERAFKEWFNDGRYEKYNINEQRGVKLVSTKFDSIIKLCSFSPQDAVDFQNYELSLNQDARASEYLYSSRESKDQDEKHKGATARSNYRFWLKRDVNKITSLIDSRFPVYPESSYHIYPNSYEVISILRQARGQSLYLDIETDADFNILCFSFSFNLLDIYCVPCINHRYSPAYTNIGNIMASLCIAMNQNEVVIHNALFDLFILGWKYKLPVGHRIYDTMLAHHRYWPEVEKSLGHAMSHLTHEEYHKDEGVFGHSSMESEMTLLQYNGKDVRGMYIARQELDKHAEEIPGLRQSIAQANRSVRPDLINTLMGIKINEEKRRAIIEENDRLMEQYLRIIKILTGGIEVLPTSNPSCVRYFHDMLDYPVIKRSERISKKTGEPTNRPSLDKKSMLQLKLKSVDHPEKFDNPVIDLCLAYRKLSTRTGWLKFQCFPIEGRCSTNWKIGGTETFRKSSTKLFETWGQNLQNPTSKACEIFEAD